MQAWNLQDPHRREPEQDDDEPEPPGELVLVAEEQGPERAGPQTEEREDGREAAYEEQRGTQSGGTRFSLAEVGYGDGGDVREVAGHEGQRSEEHTSELQSLMRISYAVFCLKKKK